MLPDCLEGQIIEYITEPSAAVFPQQLRELFRVVIDRQRLVALENGEKICVEKGVPAGRESFPVGAGDVAGAGGPDPDDAVRL